MADSPSTDKHLAMDLAIFPGWNKVPMRWLTWIKTNQSGRSPRTNPLLCVEERGSTGIALFNPYAHQNGGYGQY
jgi:hypothetical protein